MQKATVLIASKEEVNTKLTSWAEAKFGTGAKAYLDEDAEYPNCLFVAVKTSTPMDVSVLEDIRERLDTAGVMSEDIGDELACGGTFIMLPQTASEGLVKEVVFDPIRAGGKVELTSVIIAAYDEQDVAQEG